MRSRRSVGEFHCLELIRCHDERLRPSGRPFAPNIDSDVSCSGKSARPLSRRAQGSCSGLLPAAPLACVCAGPRPRKAALRGLFRHDPSPKHVYFRLVTRCGVETLPSRGSGRHDLTPEHICHDPAAGCGGGGSWLLGFYGDNTRPKGEEVVRAVGCGWKYRGFPGFPGITRGRTEKGLVWLRVVAGSTVVSRVLW